MITASQLERILHCPTSAALPTVRSSSPAAQRGTAIHRFLECAAKDRAAALDVVEEEYRPLCEAIDLDALPVGLAAEVALALDLETGRARELGRGLNRDYSAAKESEIPGTADVLGVSESAVFVADWKTGWSEVTPAQRNPQLKFLALAAARAYHRDSAIVEIIRIRENGGAWRDRAEFDVFDLDEFEATLRSVAAEVGALRQQPSKTSALSEGPWCDRCPAFLHCPAKTALVRRLADGSEADQLDFLLPLTPQMAGLAYKRWLLAKQLLKRIERAIHACAKEAPIPLGNGRYFGLIIKDGNEKLDGDVVWAVLKEQYGAQVADQAVTRAATKKRIREAIQEHLPNGTKLAPAERAVLAEVRQRGGAERPKTTKFTEYEANDQPRNEV